MIGLLRGWTHFRPLLTTRSRILRCLIFAVNTKIRKNLRFLSVLAVRGKVSVRLLSAHSKTLPGGFGREFIVGRGCLMYIDPLVLGEMSSFQMTQ